MRSVRLHRLGLLFAALAMLAVSCGTTGSGPSGPSESSSSDARDTVLAAAPLRPELPSGMREPETFPSRDLIGLTLPELRQRMGRGLLIGEISPMLVIAQENGPPLSFLTLGEALGDAWGQAYTRAGAGAPPEWADCQSVFGPAFTSQAATAQRALLVFRGEVLSEIRHPQNIRRAPEQRSSSTDWRRVPREHVFLTEPGQLPLADGANFLRRWHSPSVGPSEQITVRCQFYRASEAKPGLRLERGRSGLSASDMQGIALAPLAVFLPGINADRRTALSEGPATAALLQLGQTVPGGAEGFDKAHRRAWYYPGLDGYGVMAIDMGMAPNNNLTQRRYMTFAGVRNDRVEWIAQESGGAGFPPMMMCLDENFIVGRVRKGCSEYGDFNPVR